MQSILTILGDRVRGALARLDIDADPVVTPSQDERFGHYQSNCAMGLAKKLGRNPRNLAGAIIAEMDYEDCCQRPEIAGPGFINFTLTPAFLARSLEAIPPCDDFQTDHVGIKKTANPQTVVVDLSSPNLAKEMHVGHLRSTVIGDCVARILEFEGHVVHRENHVGDWGTQFGMLIAHLAHVRPEAMEQPDDVAIRDLESFYVEAKRRFDTDEAFAKESREAVVKLQAGDPASRRIWKAFCDESLRHCHAIYDRLDVKLIDRGESFYAEGMKDVVDRLEKIRAHPGNDAVRHSDGALCIFLDGFKTREGEPLPMIVRKSDGGFNYATSDLATLLHRVEKLGADRIVYVVGLPQKQHFAMLFSAVRMLGWASPGVSLDHLGFGSILDAAGAPFRTRDGGTIKLNDLLDEAVTRARDVVVKNQAGDANRSFSPEQIDHIAETIGLGAIKYFDLSHALNRDYKFNLDVMLSLEGNTAPYMIYAYARIRAIGRKADIDFAALPADAPLILQHPAEVDLAVTLLRFAETIDTISADLRPNVLTDYLYRLSKVFSRFYDRKLGVRVIDATPEAVRISRLRLCDLTARTLRTGLHLLGINTLEYM